MPFFLMAGTDVASNRKLASALAASGCLAPAWTPVA
jgi:hypothetical protein